MKNLRNSVQLIGRLGKDPEVKTLENGNAVATFRLATSDYYKNAEGEKVEDTQWHSIVAWGKKADLVSKYLKKGNEVAIEGKLIHRNYETSNGEMRYVSEINMNEIVMFGGKN